MLSFTQLILSAGLLCLGSASYYQTGDHNCTICVDLVNDCGEYASSGAFPRLEANLT